MRLDIGSGERPAGIAYPAISLDGIHWTDFTHMDMRVLPHIDIEADAEHILDVVSPGICEVIWACHILEHFSYRDTVDVLQKWRKALRKNGLLHVEVPNLAWQANAYVNCDIIAREFVQYLYGEQDYEGNFHKAGFDAAALEAALLLAGYERVRIMDIGQVLIAEGRNVAGEEALQGRA